MNKEKIITEWKELEGKTIKTVRTTRPCVDVLFLTFEDNTRAILRSNHGYDDDTELDLEPIAGAEDWELNKVGWITDEEFEKRNEECAKELEEQAFRRFLILKERFEKK